MREHILPPGESGFQARRGQCGLRTVSILNTTKPHPDTLRPTCLAATRCYPSPKNPLWESECS